jgi:hypothetical protein
LGNFGFTFKTIGPDIYAGPNISFQLKRIPATQHNNIKNVTFSGICHLQDPLDFGNFTFSPGKVTEFGTLTYFV